MAMCVQILGHETSCRDHSAFRIEAGEANILIDPFGPITRPGTTDGAADLSQEVDKGR
jgi:L-ascorbate metabolism protein UlaG (beta-lactamase superfamily)